jgi:hypothetical protein
VEQGHAGRRLCRDAREDGARQQGLGGGEARAGHTMVEVAALGDRRCNGRLNRPRDIVLGSNSNEEKDAAAHRAGTHL